MLPRPEIYKAVKEAIQEWMTVPWVKVDDKYPPTLEERIIAKINENTISP